MNQPRRLLDQPLEGLAGELLRAGAGERAPERTAERTLGVLGLGTGVAGGSAAGAASSTLATSGAAGSSTAASLGGTSAGKVALLITAKWLGIGMGVGLVTASVAGRAFWPEPARSDAPPQATASVAQRPLARNTALARASTAEPHPATLRTRTPSPRRALRLGTPPRVRTTPAPTATPASSGVAVAAFAGLPEPQTSASPQGSTDLAREVALVDKARAAVSVGSYNRALALISRHQQEFPHGALGPEVLVLEVEALAGSGNLLAAERVGRPILEHAPKSLEAARVRRALGLGATPPTDP